MAKMAAIVDATEAEGEAGGEADGAMMGKDDIGKLIWAVENGGTVKSTPFGTLELTEKADQL